MMTRKNSSRSCPGLKDLSDNGEAGMRYSEFGIQISNCGFRDKKKGRAFGPAFFVFRLFVSLVSLPKTCQTRQAEAEKEQRQGLGGRNNISRS